VGCGPPARRASRSRSFRAVAAPASARSRHSSAWRSRHSSPEPPVPAARRATVARQPPSCAERKSAWGRSHQRPMGCQRQDNKAGFRSRLHDKCHQVGPHLVGRTFGATWTATPVNPLERLPRTTTVIERRHRHNWHLFILVHRRFRPGDGVDHDPRNRARARFRMANLYANVVQIDRAAQLRECFQMLTERSARLLKV
jgi:hypothetical protein